MVIKFHYKWSMTTIKNILAKLFPMPQAPSNLAISIFKFTNESHLEQLNRQGRLYEYLANK